MASPRDMWVEIATDKHVASEAYWMAQQELAFIVSEEYTNASTGETATLALSNPSDSGVTAVFHQPVAAPQAASYARIYEDFSSAPSGGTTVQIQNWLSDTGGGAPDSGALTVSRGVSFTAESTYYSQPVGGGLGANSIGGRAEFPLIALEPGREVVIEVEKLVSDGDNVALSAVWFEAPVVFSEETTDPPLSEVF